MKHFNRLIMVLVYLFLYAPLLVMVVFSFSGGDHTSVFQIVQDRPFTTGMNSCSARETPCCAVCGIPFSWGWSRQ